MRASFHLLLRRLRRGDGVIVGGVAPARGHIVRRATTGEEADVDDCAATPPTPGRPGPDIRRYEFRVAGLLSERTRGAFPDMTVVDAPPETVIVGDVLDDAHLYGVLGLLQDLGLRLTALRQVAAPSAPADGDRTTAPARRDRRSP